MEILMQHPDHGLHVVYSEEEVNKHSSLGWNRIEIHPAILKQNSYNSDTVAPVQGEAEEAPSSKVAKRGRPPKGA